MSNGFVRDPSFWRKRLPLPQGRRCHYGEFWMNLFALVVRRLGACRVLWPIRGNIRGKIVVDVGCGDGRFGHWLSRVFGVSVLGVDPFCWPGVECLEGFIQGAGEELSELVDGACTGLVMFVTSLPFMTDWQKALREAAAITNRILVVDDLQVPTPPWQIGHLYKEHLEYPCLVDYMCSLGFLVERAVPVSLLDRRLFLRAPGFLAFVVTLSLDIFLSFLIEPLEARYVAVLFLKQDTV